MGSSTRLANIVSCIASRVFFLIIILQIPLFRVPCRSGICTTPVQVTSSQLIASEILPEALVKALLYPGAAADAVVKKTNIANSSELLEVYNLTNVKHASVVTDIKHLEIIAGSYLAVTGAILGLLKQDRLSLFGMLLLLWGLIKDVISRNPTGEFVLVYPTIIVAIAAASCSVRVDVREIIRCFQAHSVANEARENKGEEMVSNPKQERELKRLEWTVNYGSDVKSPRATKAVRRKLVEIAEGEKHTDIRSV